MKIENITDLAAHIGAAHPTHDSIARRLYKDTECGVCCTVTEEGISVSGYVEGFDGECTERNLKFPFDTDTLGATLTACDDEAEEIFSEMVSEDAY